MLFILNAARRQTGYDNICLSYVNIVNIMKDAHLSMASRWANILQSLLLEFGGSKHWQSCLRKTLPNLNKQPKN